MRLTASVLASVMIATASALTIMRNFLHCILKSVLTLFFCLALAVPAGAGEPPWLRISSAHFSLLTDAGDKRGPRLGHVGHRARPHPACLRARAAAGRPYPAAAGGGA